jgi:hypothetical protein
MQANFGQYFGLVRFLVKVSLSQFSALRVFSVAQNLRAKLGLYDFLQVAPEVLTTKEKNGSRY